MPKFNPETVTAINEYGDKVVINKGDSKTIEHWAERGYAIAGINGTAPSNAKPNSDGDTSIVDRISKAKEKELLEIMSEAKIDVDLDEFKTIAEKRTAVKNALESK